MKKVLSLILLLCVFLASAQDNYVVILPTDNEVAVIKKAANVVPSPRQLRWQQLEMTAFFHFGMNTFTNREWGLGNESEKLFNPTQLDAGQWVKTVKAAGIKQVIVTAKHHDGFCLWPSKYTEHSVKNSPWKSGKGDVVKEVAEACKKNNIGFGVYLSPWDRNAAFYGDYEKYNAYFENQLTELLTNYGRVDEVWFDGANGEGPNGKKQEYDFNSWYKLIRKLQPNAVIAISGPDVRWVGTESGYGREIEWSVLPMNNKLEASAGDKSQQDVNIKPAGDMTGNDLGSRDKLMHAKGLVWYPAETDVSIRPGWFYHPNEDSLVKPADKLADIYFSSVGRNSLLLLNIPPDKSGLISDIDVVHLREFKQKLNAIFKTNLAIGATIKCSNGLNMPAMLDGKDNTNFISKNNDTTTVIFFDLKGNKTFDILLLQENIRVGQRIEKFVLEYKNNNNEWQKITEGKTVGHKRLLRFKPISAHQIRLKIESSRLNPTIAEFGIY